MGADGFGLGRNLGWRVRRTVSVARKTLGYGRQLVDEEDVAAVVEVLRGDSLTCGPAIEAFERALALEEGRTSPEAEADTGVSKILAGAAENFGKRERKGAADELTLRREIINEIEAHQPHFIVGFGVSGHPRIALERIALNYFDAARPDNNGKIVRHKPIIPKAPLALETNFPIEEMHKFMQAQEIPSAISYHAHTYLCNYAYYLCLHQLHEKKTNAKIIFIHIPFSPKEVNALEANAPSFPVENIAEVIEKFMLKIEK